MLFSQEIFVNLDPVVLEVLQEAKCMSKMGFSVPKSILTVCASEVQLKAQQNK